MKAVCFGLAREGFLAHLGLRFENGLELINRNQVTFGGKAEMVKQFQETIAGLKAVGVEVDDSNLQTLIDKA